jgi:glutaredoxin
VTPRLALLLLAAALAAPARAQVYTWTDADGTVHFGEEPPPKGTRAKKLRLPSEQPPRDEPAQAKVPDRGDDAPAPQAKTTLKKPAAAPRAPPKVELYTTTWCGWCSKARAWFQGKGIAYTDHDIEADPAALERRLGMGGGQGVPVAVIGGTVVRGFAPAQYEAALAQR